MACDLSRLRSILTGVVILATLGSAAAQIRDGGSVGSKEPASGAASDGSVGAGDDYPDGHATVFVTIGRKLAIGRKLECSGVVIGENRVLTAAHCFEGCGERCHERLQVGFGKVVSPDPKISGAVPVKQVLIYPGYSEMATLPGRDFAVLVLPDLREINIHPDLRRPVKVLLASSFLASPPRQLNVVGYGISSLTAGRASAGRRLDTPVELASSTCTEQWSIATGCAPFQEFILSNAVAPGTATLRTRDTCRGDSGGPALIVNKIPPRILVGITSRAVRRSGDSLECGPGGIYGLVGALPVLRWLQAAVPDLSVIAEY